MAGTIKKYDELLCCESCGQIGDDKTPLFDTAWSGVHWCGSASCAHTIMRDNCDNIDVEPFAEDVCEICEESDCICEICEHCGENIDADECECIIVDEEIDE